MNLFSDMAKTGGGLGPVLLNQAYYSLFIGWWAKLGWGPAKPQAPGVDMFGACLTLMDVVRLYMTHNRSLVNRSITYTNRFGTAKIYANYIALVDAFIADAELDNERPNAFYRPFFPWYRRIAAAIESNWDFWFAPGLEPSRVPQKTTPSPRLPNAVDVAWLAERYTFPFFVEHVDPARFAISVNEAKVVQELNDIRLERSLGPAVVADLNWLTTGATESVLHSSLYEGINYEYSRQALILSPTAELVNASLTHRLIGRRDSKATAQAIAILY